MVKRYLVQDECSLIVIIIIPVWNGDFWWEKNIFLKCQNLETLFLNEDFFSDDDVDDNNIDVDDLLKKINTCKNFSIVAQTV